MELADVGGCKVVGGKVEHSTGAARQFMHSRGYVMCGRNHAENESNRIEQRIT